MVSTFISYYIFVTICGIRIHPPRRINSAVRCINYSITVNRLMLCISPTCVEGKIFRYCSVKIISLGASLVFVPSNKYKFVSVRCSGTSKCFSIAKNNYRIFFITVIVIKCYGNFVSEFKSVFVGNSIGFCRPFCARSAAECG